MDISSQTHVVVLNDDDQPIIEGEKVLLLCKKDQTYIYTEIDDYVQEEFGLRVVDCDEANNQDLWHKGITDSLQEKENFVWQHTSTLLLLNEYKKRVEKFRNPKFMKKILWEEISNSMKEKGHMVNGDLLDRKMRNMKNTYRTILDNNNKKKTTGTGRLTWPYFNIFEEIFIDDKTINFGTVMSSTKEGSRKDDLLNQKIMTSPNTLQSDSDQEISFLATPTTSQLTPRSTPKSTQKHTRYKELDRFRKRQLEIEEEKLSELKKLRQCIEKHNEIEELKARALQIIAENKV